MHENRAEDELTLPAALARLSPCELALIEGWKTAPVPKLEVYRQEVDKPLLHPSDPHIVGIATDVPARFQQRRLAVFHLDAIDEIATFVLDHAAVRPFYD
jgi:molybdopterin-guanine dinucleotide biosynthesis protein B